MFNHAFAFHSTNIIFMLQDGEIAEMEAEPTSRDYINRDHFAWGIHLVKSDISLQDGKLMCNCSKYDICKLIIHTIISTVYSVSLSP